VDTHSEPSARPAGAPSSQTSGFDNARFELHELTDAGDQVLAWATLRGRGKQGAAETSWGVWTVREGRTVRFQTFTDWDAALEAAGLRE
jgi:ketosteroid isomerase-like protein